MVTGDHGILGADTLTADLSYWANGSTHTQWDALTAFRAVPPSPKETSPATQSPNENP